MSHDDGGEGSWMLIGRRPSAQRYREEDAVEEEEEILFPSTTSSTTVTTRLVVMVDEDELLMLSTNQKTESVNKTFSKRSDLTSFLLVGLVL